MVAPGGRLGPGEGQHALAVGGMQSLTPEVGLGGPRRERIAEQRPGLRAHEQHPAGGHVELGHHAVDALHQAAEPPLGRLGVGAGAPLGGEEPGVVQGDRRLIGKRLQQPSRLVVEGGAAPGRHPQGADGLATHEEGGGHDGPEVVPLKPLAQLRRKHDAGILERVPRRERAALVHGPTDQADTPGQDQRRRCVDVHPGERDGNQVARGRLQPVHGTVAGAQQGDHAVGDELGDDVGIERVGQRLAHGRQRLGLAAAALPVGVEAHVLDGERGLDGQRAERVQGLRLGRRRGAAEDGEHTLEGIAGRERNADEPAHALGQQELALDRARIPGRILDDQRLPAAGHVAGEPLTDREVDR